jgi:hypothetical protein
MANLSSYRGDDYTVDLTFTDSNGVAIDITNYKIYFTLKNKFSDTDALAVLQKTITSHTAPLSGQSQITLTAAETDDLCGVYKYDMQYITGSGTVKTFAYGEFTFTEDITRAIT